MARILVVDDSPVEQTFIRGLIQAKMPEVDVVVCNDGRLALAALAEQRPDLILTDLHMPAMSGLELIETIRFRDDSLPIVLMTSQGSEEVAVQAILAGAASYVPKGELDKYLITTLDSVLRLSQRRTAHRLLLRSLVHQDLRFCLDNDPQLITPFVEMVQQHILAAGQFSESEMTRIGVALHESLTNAIYHGNLELDSELRQEDDRRFYALGEQRRAQEPYRSRRVYVAATLAADHVDFRIRDDGPGFDGRAMLAQLEDISLERIGGRGLLLIHSFMDFVTFNAAGNEIRFGKRAAVLQPSDMAGGVFAAAEF